MTIRREYTEPEKVRQTTRPERLVVSAGGIIYRLFRGRPKVALVYIKKWKGWGLPKGHVDPGESLRQTALREVREETGLSGDIVRKIRMIRYCYFEGGTRIGKRVHYYLMRYRSGSVQDHDTEVAEVKWMPIPQAMKSLKYENDCSVIRQLKPLLK